MQLEVPCSSAPTAHDAMHPNSLHQSSYALIASPAFSCRGPGPVVPCGNGVVGTGLCSNANLCCSSQGTCGASEWAVPKDSLRLAHPVFGTQLLLGAVSRLAPVAQPPEVALAVPPAVPARLWCMPDPPPHPPARPLAAAAASACGGLCFGGPCLRTPITPVHVPEDPLATTPCGNGDVGTKQCPAYLGSNFCCSKWGYCGTTPDHCGCGRGGGFSGRVAAAGCGGFELGADLSGEDRTGCAWCSASGAHARWLGTGCRLLLLLLSSSRACIFPNTPCQHHATHPPLPAGPTVWAAPAAPSASPRARAVLSPGCAPPWACRCGHGSERLPQRGATPYMNHAGCLPLPGACYPTARPPPATTTHARPSARPLAPAGAWAWCSWWQWGGCSAAAPGCTYIDSFQNCLLACVTALQFSHAAHMYAVGGRCHFPLTARPTLFPLPALFCIRLAPFQRPLAGQQLSSFFFPHFLSSDRRVLACFAGSPRRGILAGQVGGFVDPCD